MHEKVEQKTQKIRLKDSKTRRHQAKQITSSTVKSSPLDSLQCKF